MMGSLAGIRAGTTGHNGPEFHSGRNCSGAARHRFEEPRAMAYIHYVPRDQASGLLAELYERYSAPHGEPDNIIRIHSLNPRSMKDHVDLYSHLMRGRSPLSRIQREMIAVAVSSANDCFY